MSLTLALPAFGLLGDRAPRLAESDEALARYWAWRGAFFRGPGGLLATFDARGQGKHRQGNEADGTIPAVRNI